jgi:hypothetical protein
MKKIFTYHFGESSINILLEIRASLSIHALATFFDKTPSVVENAKFLKETHLFVLVLTDTHFDKSPGIKHYLNEYEAIILKDPNYKMKLVTFVDKSLIQDIKQNVNNDPIMKILNGHLLLPFDDDQYSISIDKACYTIHDLIESK